MDRGDGVRVAWASSGILHLAHTGGCIEVLPAGSQALCADGRARAQAIVGSQAVVASVAAHVGRAACTLAQAWHSGATWCEREGNSQRGHACASRFCFEIDWITLSQRPDLGGMSSSKACRSKKHSGMFCNYQTRLPSQPYASIAPNRWGFSLHVMCAGRLER